MEQSGPFEGGSKRIIYAFAVAFILFSQSVFKDDAGASHRPPPSEQPQRFLRLTGVYDLGHFQGPLESLDDAGVFTVNRLEDIFFLGFLEPTKASPVGQKSSEPSSAQS